MGILHTPNKHLWTSSPGRIATSEELQCWFNISWWRRTLSAPKVSPANLEVSKFNNADRSCNFSEAGSSKNQSSALD